MITPNTLTIARVFMTAAICAILLTASGIPTLMLGFLLFVLACLTDWWDGKLAREKGMITNFGKIADPIADKVLVLGLLFSFVYLKIYSIWWVVPIFIREVVVTWIRTQKILQGKVIAAEFSGKLKTVVQLLATGAAFLVLLAMRAKQPAETINLLNMLVYATLFAANALTLFSGYLFLKRNVN